MTTDPSKTVQAPAAEIASPPGSRVRLKKILVPHDFSEAADLGLDYARDLARPFGATLVLLHSDEINYAGIEGFIGVDTHQIRKEILKESRKKLRRIAGQKGNPPPSFEIKVLVGHAAQGILDTAEDLHADLIVMATHGRTRLQQVLLGSTTEKVVRHAPCPVLVVR